MYSDSGRFLATSHHHVVRIWDTRQYQLHATLMGHFERVRSMAFSGDDQTLVTGADGGWTTFWDVRTGQELMSYDLNMGAPYVAFSNRGQKLIAVSNTVRDDRLHGCLVDWSIAGNESVKHDASSISAP